MRPLSSSTLWKRAPSAGSLLVGILVGLLFATFLRRGGGGESDLDNWRGSGGQHLRPNTASTRLARSQVQLPSLKQRLRILELLGTLSGKHTKECTRYPQELYVEQAKERYSALVGHERSWRSGRGMLGWLFGRADQLSVVSKSDTRFSSRHDSMRRDLMSRGNADGHKYFFAINLFNSFDVIPDLFSTLFKVAAVLGYHNVFVSIYENGSKDQTKALLILFSALCRTVGLEVEIRQSPRSRGTFNHRIEYLAEVRNAAMEPLREQWNKNGRTFDSIVFMNDILPCIDDILELIWQSRRQNAGITCAADYMYHDEIGAPVFYDNWVARDLNGTALNNAPFEQVFVHAESNRRFQHHLPIQVQSCWNGVAVLDPTPFYDANPVKFRMADIAEKECSASECSLICNDYFTKGYGRIIMVPRVKLAYDKKVFDIIHPDRRNLTAIRGYKRLGGLPDDPRSDPQDRSWYGPHDRLFTAEEDEELDFKPGPKYVWCWGWDGAGDLDGPDVAPIWEPQASRAYSAEAVEVKHNRNLPGYK